MKPTQRSDLESFRLTFAAGILASCFAYLAVRKDYFLRWIDHSVEIWFMAGIGASAVFSFLFLLATASELKYNHRAHVGYFEVSGNSRRTLFDLSVDVLGISILYLAMMSVIQLLNNHFLHNNIVIGAGNLFLIFFGIIFFKFCWSLILYLLSLLYEENRKNAPKIVKETGWLIVFLALAAWNFYVFVRAEQWWLKIFAYILMIFALCGCIVVFGPLSRFHDKLYEVQVSILKTTTKPIIAILKKTHQLFLRIKQ